MCTPLERILIKLQPYLHYSNTVQKLLPSKEALVADTLSPRENAMAAIKKLISQNNKFPSHFLPKPIVRFSLEVQQVSKFHRRIIEAGIMKTVLARNWSIARQLLKYCIPKPTRKRGMNSLAVLPPRTSLMFSTRREHENEEVACPKTSFLLSKNGHGYERPPLEERLALVDHDIANFRIFTGPQRRSLRKRALSDSKHITNLPAVVWLSKSRWHPR